MFHEDNCISEDLNSTPRDLMPSFPLPPCVRTLYCERSSWPSLDSGTRLEHSRRGLRSRLLQLIHFFVDVQSTAFLFLFFLASNWLHSLPCDCGFYASSNSKLWRGEKPREVGGGFSFLLSSGIQQLRFPICAQAYRLRVWWYYTRGHVL